MKILSRKELGSLMVRQGGWCVSIYMPTHRAFTETKQDQITFKNLVRQSADQLRQCGLRVTDVNQILKPVKKLLDDSFFWQRQGEGLAIFASAQSFAHYRIPLVFENLVVVTDRFHVKPLLPLWSDSGRFFIIALSLNQVRCFECSRFNIKELEIQGAPKNLSEVLMYDDPQKQLQWHTQTPGRTGQRAAMFHGHGGGIDDKKDNILRFFQQVDSGLKDILREERAPLVFAGVDYLFSIFREACTYQFLAEHAIIGNPEALQPSDLLTQSWKIVEPYFLKVRGDAMEKYLQFQGKDQASDQVEAVAKRAYEGRIESLFVSVGLQKWGRFDASSGAVFIHDDAEPGDEDILNFSAVHTILNGGMVFIMRQDEIPGKTGVAALIR